MCFSASTGRVALCLPSAFTCNLAQGTAAGSTAQIFSSVGAARAWLQGRNEIRASAA